MTPTTKTVCTFAISILALVASCGGTDSDGQSSAISPAPVLSTPAVSLSSTTTEAPSTTSVIPLTSEPTVVPTIILNPREATEITLPPVSSTSTAPEVSSEIEFPEPVESASGWFGGLDCELYEEGTVACYEHNSFRASNGLEEYVETEMEYVEGISDATQLVAGANHVCTVHADGTVSCWRSSGSLEDGTEARHIVPVKVAGISEVVSISANYYHTCVVLAAGEAFCWGRNSDGQLGNGTYEDSADPVQVLGIEDAVSISTDSSHTCVVHADRTISCWGKNEYGQLGDRTTNDSPVPVKVLGVDDAQLVSPGIRYTCYIHLDGGVSCWGNGDYGIFRDGNSYFESENPCLTYECESELSMDELLPYISLTPKRIPGLSNVVYLSTDFTACAILEDGSVECWGCLPDFGGCREGHYPEDQEEPMGSGGEVVS